MQEISGILAEKVTVWYNNKSESSEHDLIVVKYGLELIFENVIKAILLIGVAVFMNKVYETILVIGVFSILRHNAGGIHMKSSIGCSLSMLFMWALGVFGSTRFVASNELIIVLLFFSFLALYFYAPCDTKNNPIQDVAIRKKKKFLSIAFIALLAVIMLVIRDAQVKALILIPLLFEIVTILPIVNYINQKHHKEVVK